MANEIRNLIAIDGLYHRAYRYNSYDEPKDLNKAGLTISSMNPTIEQVKTAVVVFLMGGFNAQKYDGGLSKMIFYIPKYHLVYTVEQLKDFLLEHSDQLFMLVTDEAGEETQIWAFVDSVPNKLKTIFFKFDGSTGQMVKIASICNKEGTCFWDNDSIKMNKDFVSSIFEERDHYNGDQLHIKLTSLHSKDLVEYERDIHSFRIIGMIDPQDRFDSQQVDTSEIMLRFLKLPGFTRIVSEADYDSIDYEVSVSDRAMDSITARYGFICDGPSYNFRHIHQDIEFDEGSDLDSDTWERIKTYLTQKLLNNNGTKERLGRYRNYALVETKDIIVISGSIGLHRRPVYHYVKAFKNTDVIDVVELARGELLIKDMIPVDCYYLNGKTGKYCKISHTNFSNMKYKITRAEVDRVSFAEWNEEKSLHPQLLAAINEAGKGSIALQKIKLFNRIPFGALFLEHLIKSTRYELAQNFAEYITDRADNMNYTCSSLSDLLPGCDPDGTSLMKVLNCNKPSFDLLMSHIDEYGTGSVGGSVEEFKSTYRAIKQLIPDGIVNKDREKLFNCYMELRHDGWSTYHCRTGRTIDIIDYPKEIKAISKMIDKIKNAALTNDCKWEMLRHYQEIVGAYFQFKDFGWDPAESLIFIEFGMGDRLQTRQMLRDREHAANTALEIYRTKIDEIAHEQSEKRYARRKAALKKLTAIPDKKLPGAAALKPFIILAPSQIYGEDVVGSIEKEGADMNHCVYRSYAEKISSGEYTVLYLRLKNKPEESLVTIGITKEGRINQTFGQNDQEISKEQAAAIVAWAQSKAGLVTFKSEHTNVPPGGWPHGVETPDLPEPEINWLRTLAKTE